MNSRQYAKMREEQYKVTLHNAGIKEGDYTSVCLSADQQEYEVTMKDGTDRIIPSVLPVHID